MPTLCRFIAKKIPVTELITNQEVLQRLGVSQSTLYRLIKSKRIPDPVVINKRIKGWRADVFDEYLRQLK